MDTLIIFPDEVQEGDVIVGSTGTRTLVLNRYRPDFRDETVCITASIEGSSQVESLYYNLNRTVKVERAS